ncbi:MAG TPA: leucine-rich repeat domain-containing protein [Polyangiaceae bacterium]|nr:leucine-rich repeat domain-containing protein [Polyangiaceae bacterium]
MTRARLLLDALAWMYIGRVVAVEGDKKRLTIPDAYHEDSYDRWQEVLREAPRALLEPAKLRRIVEEAIGESQLKVSDRFGGRLGERRVVELLRGFVKALDLGQFVAPEARPFRDWVSAVLALPLPESGATPDDLLLRAQVDALSEADRQSTTDIEIASGETLTDLRPLAELPSLRSLYIFPAPALVDLGPLMGLSGLEVLRLSAPTLRDLSFLRGLPRLRRLELSAAENPDLAPLRALTHLEELSVEGCDDLSPLEGLRALTKLTVSIRHAQPRLEPLRHLVGLRELHLHGVKLESADVVLPFTSLVSLTLGDCEPLADLGALGRLTDLEELDLALSPVTDLSPLKSLSKLRVLDLYATPIRTWPPLRDLPRLEELNVMGTELRGFAGLEHAQALRQLEVGPSEAPGFSDLTPLAALTELRSLYFDTLTDLTDLSPLRALTNLQSLYVGDSAVHDLTPLVGLTALENVSLPGTAIEDVAPLAGLPNLRYLFLQRCQSLRSIEPLAANRSLESVDCSDSDALRGPSTLEELRNPPPETQARKRFPSAGPPVNRPGTLPAFDARAHLPRRPPEGWSLPERGDHEQAVFWMDVEDDARATLMLLNEKDDYLVMIHLWRNGGLPVTDKLAGRILRRFRASDAFIESEELLAGDVPGVRCFIARAHAATPDSWGDWRSRAPLLRIEAAVGENDSDSDTTAGNPGESDVRHHLPSPLPRGWSVRPTKEPADVACLISAPEAEMVALLRLAPSSDAHELVVSVFPAAGRGDQWVKDEEARALLTPFRQRGPFEESRPGAFERARKMRIFVATATSK